MKCIAEGAIEAFAVTLSVLTPDRPFSGWPFRARKRLIPSILYPCPIASALGGEDRQIKACELSEYPTVEALLQAVRGCRACERHLSLGPRPVLQAGESARVLIVGQAPGARAHASGIPWSDASGERLRAWMGVEGETFYDTSRIAIVPMGFCYPGRGRGGDLPPRRECASLWLDLLLSRLQRIELTLLIGRYAQQHFLGERCKSTLAETVRAWKEYAPAYFPLPHPSPRNQLWFRANPWFERQLIPELRKRIGPLGCLLQGVRSSAFPVPCVHLENRRVV